MSDAPVICLHPRDVERIRRAFAASLYAPGWPRMPGDQPPREPTPLPTQTTHLGVFTVPT